MTRALRVGPSPAASAAQLVASYRLRRIGNGREHALVVRLSEAGLPWRGESATEHDVVVNLGWGDEFDSSRFTGALAPVL